MSEPQGNAGLGRDALGLLLIVVGVFFGVFTVMATIHPQEHPNATSAAFMALVAGVGTVAALFLALGILIVGVRLWIAGISGRIARDLFGVLVTTITLAILMGAASSGLGGTVGDLLGGSVTRRLTIFVGIPYGLAFVLLPAWFLWLRPRELFAWDEAQPAGQAPERAEPAAARPSGQPFAPAHPKTTDTGGVSAAEAAALLPPTPSQRKPLAQTPAPATSPSSPIQPAVQPSAATPISVAKPLNLPRNNAPSPYPVDVRVHGGIPEGARPIESPHARIVQDSPPDTPAVQRGLARETSAPQQPAGAHLAGAERAVVFERGPASGPVAGSEVRQPAPAAPPRVESTAVVTPAVAPPPFEVDSPVAAADIEPPAVESPAGDEEIEQAFEDAVEIEREVAFVAEVEEVEELDQPPVVEARAQPAPLAPDVMPFSATPPAPSWEQPGLFAEPAEAPADVPVDAYGTPLSLVEELRKSNGELAASLERELPVADVVAEVEVAEEAAEVAEAEPVHEHKPAPRGLFDEPEEAAPAPMAQLEDEEDEELLDDDDRAQLAEEGEGEADEVDVEHDAVVAAELRVVVDETLEVDAEIPEVVLQPVAPPAPRSEEPAPSKSKPKPKRDMAVDELVYRAGCLFLERQRVAVSMLQRDFGLDFKAATEVLDQLQKAGLIGPYLGGQRRDILITREQWDQLVGVS